jgi:hypothetical protein
VIVDGWAPAQAWEQEVLAYGHEPTPIHREIKLAFEEHVLEHELRTRTATVAPERTRVVAKLVDGTAEAALVRAPGEDLDGRVLAESGSRGGGRANAQP